MKVYIANCTKQHHRFPYWPHSGTKIVAPVIRSGTQIAIDGTKEDLEHILKQHETYGLCEVREALKAPKFSGICYQFDRPMDVDKLMEGIERRKEWEDKRSQIAREESAAAADQVIQATGARIGQAVVEVEQAVEEIKQPQDASTRTPFKSRVRTDRNVRGKSVATAA